MSAHPKLNVELLAPAKLNLSLEVLGPAEDGYHQVATVLHTIALADRLSFSPQERLEVVCRGLDLPQEENLVWRAARLLQERSGTRRGALITLTKAIPVASGLGGGSSDAATTLKGLNMLWNLGLSQDVLLALARTLGADVPFFLLEGCALAEGRGDRLSRLPPVEGWWAVVLHIPTGVSHKTAHMYGLLTGADSTDGSETLALAHHLRRGQVSPEVLAHGRNAFERAALLAFPGLEEARQAMLEAGAPWVRLTGTGPALFTLVGDRATGEDLKKRLRSPRWKVFLTRLTERPQARASGPLSPMAPDGPGSGVAARATAPKRRRRPPGLPSPPPRTRGLAWEG
ncbi:MAG: 4-(cytidine 5'-diphospho)-2-C-methyl-D-erythritol kinase [Chloroflexi bacterium]|nr:4-(cytidine 5'-diphospho)-2-C-methyl-D-erythritol kinase [Chloroflexota bacterium]